MVELSKRSSAPQAGNMDAGARGTIGGRVVGVVGALEAGERPGVVDCAQLIVLCAVGKTLTTEAGLAELTDGPCGWLAASAMAEVLAMI